jgi:hypothetical protein
MSKKVPTWKYRRLRRELRQVYQILSRMGWGSTTEGQRVRLGALAKQISKDPGQWTVRGIELAIEIAVKS